MAANTGVIEGQDLLVFYNGAAIAHATSHSIEPSGETRDRVSKDTGKWKQKVAGLLGWKANCEALACYDGNSHHTLHALMLARTAVTVKLGGRTTLGGNDNFKLAQIGDKYLEGTAFITGLPLTAPNNADATFSCSFEGTGKLEVKTKLA